MTYSDNSSSIGIGHNNGPEHGLDALAVQAIEAAAQELVPWPLEVVLADAFAAGQLKPWQRLVAQRNAGLRSQIRLARRGGDCGPAIISLIVALSDNAHGRSNISLARIARVLKRKEVDERVQQLIRDGYLCRESTGPNSAQTWVPLARHDLEQKPTDLVEALAPKVPRGRPPKNTRASDAGVIRNTPESRTGVNGNTSAPGAGVLTENARSREPGYYGNTPASDAGVNGNTPGLPSNLTTELVRENGPITTTIYNTQEEVSGDDDDEARFEDGFPHDDCSQWFDTLLGLMESTSQHCVDNETLEVFCNAFVPTRSAEGGLAWSEITTLAGFMVLGDPEHFVGEFCLVQDASKNDGFKNVRMAFGDRLLKTIGFVFNAMPNARARDLVRAARVARTELQMAERQLKLIEAVFAAFPPDSIAASGIIKPRADAP